MLFYQFTKEISKIHPNYFKWGGSMFLYGFTRGLNSEYNHSNDFLHSRIFFSTLNGIVYMSPYGIIKLKHFIDRSLKISEKQNPFIYHEFFGVNRNTFI